MGGLCGTGVAVSFGAVVGVVGGTVGGVSVGVVVGVLVGTVVGVSVGAVVGVLVGTVVGVSVGAVVGATLGLLAFLLAFTFGMAADRFENRRHALVDETNAIETGYLRAELLIEPHRSEVRKILREYVEERLQWAGVEKVQVGRSVKELQPQVEASRNEIMRLQSE